MNVTNARKLEIGETVERDDFYKGCLNQRKNSAGSEIGTIQKENGIQWYRPNP